VNISLKKKKIKKMNTLILFFVFTPILIAFLLIINLFLPISKPDIEKLSPYECGMGPLGNSREKFNVKFYLIGILFIIFDLEIIFLFPFAVILNQISLFGFWIAIIFIFLLTMGFYYEFTKGALKFVKNADFN
jgi:NADH:ubiquinone oxidoreductase subunit 3 (subunit A)